MDIRDKLLELGEPWTQTIGSMHDILEINIVSSTDKIVEACNFALSGGFSQILVECCRANNPSVVKSRVEDLLDIVSSKLLCNIYRFNDDTLWKIEIFVDESLVDSREAVRSEQ